MNHRRIGHHPNMSTTDTEKEKVSVVAVENPRETTNNSKTCLGLVLPVLYEHDELFTSLQSHEYAYITGPCKRLYQHV